MAIVLYAAGVFSCGIVTGVALGFSHAVFKDWRSEVIRGWWWAALAALVCLSAAGTFVTAVVRP